mmetsp:Transcript_51903/g.151142  ORF Transcript_51903/g.151142 Transcript_51903/m.151142 type:complete len:1274 (+) Transcript_51903:87-3908(+)
MGRREKTAQAQEATDVEVADAAAGSGVGPSRGAGGRAYVAAPSNPEDVAGEAESPEVPAGARAMNAICSLLDEKHMRLQDLFRHPSYNPSYTESVGHEAMNAKTICGVLRNAGLELPLPEVKQMLDCLDTDFSGTLDIREFEVALRNHRRGNVDWQALAEQAAQNKKEKKPVNIEHIHRLSDNHKAKLESLKAKRERLEQEEAEKIRLAKAENRLGSRKDLTERDFDPVRSTERLYLQHVELEQRKRQRQQELECQEQKRIDEAVAKIRGRRSSSTPALREVDIGSISERLHGHREARERNLQNVRREAEANILALTDTIGQKALARGMIAPERHQALYDEAEQRRDRRENQARKILKAESAQWAENLIGRGREALTPDKMTRIHMLYEERSAREKRRKDMAITRFKQEMTEIQRAAEKARENTAKQLEAVKGKLRDNAPFKTPESSVAEMDTPRRSPHPVGFGSQAPRTWLLGEDNKSSWCIESVGHALNTINMAVASRCNCVPDEGQLAALRDLVEPLKETMQEYRDASGESELQGQGFTALRNMSSRRLFSDGCLLEDPVGWHECCEPDPLVQVQEDFDSLMEVAERAQAALLAKIGPEERSDGITLGRAWPVGAKWNHPRATKKAHFAINAGVKPRDKASVKAFVRYGPSSGEGRYRNLTDLARCALIFVDASLLRAGLEQIIEKFEVIDVRNYYHPSYQNLLGEKYVEVLVVIKCPEPFICEIRLEEMSFMIARERVRPRMEQVANTLADIYHQAGADEAAIKYLVQWTLQRPKENHSVTVFKKHLARRFGSTVVAWRKVLGNGRLAPFGKFREACQLVGQRPRTVEYWQSLDSSKAGCLSLFELDPEATILLIKVYWRICGLATPEQMADPNALFHRLTSRLKLVNPGKVQAHEFRRLLKPLGFSPIESDRIFACLDAHGGDGCIPPATVTPVDIGWLQRLPKLVDFESAMLRNACGMAEMDTLRTLMSTGAAAGGEDRRMRIPAGAGRKSVHGSQVASCIPRASLFARRSVSAPPSQAALAASRLSARQACAGSAAASPRASPRLLPPAPEAEAAGSESPSSSSSAPGSQAPSPRAAPCEADAEPLAPPTAEEAAVPTPRGDRQQSSSPPERAKRATAKSGAAGPMARDGGTGVAPSPPELSVGDTVCVSEQLYDSRRTLVRRGLTGKVVSIESGAQGSILVSFSGTLTPRKILAKDAGSLVVTVSSPISGKASSRLDSTGSTQSDPQREKGGGGIRRKRTFLSDDEGLELAGEDDAFIDDLSETF